MGEGIASGENTESSRVIGDTIASFEVVGVISGEISSWCGLRLPAHLPDDDEERHILTQRSSGKEFWRSDWIYSHLALLRQASEQ